MSRHASEIRPRRSRRLDSRFKESDAILNRYLQAALKRAREGGGTAKPSGCGSRIAMPNADRCVITGVTERLEEAWTSVVVSDLHAFALMRFGVTG